MSALGKKVQEAIQSELPAMVSKELTSYITHLEEEVKRLEDADADLKHARKQFSDIADKDRKYGDLAQREAALKQGEEKLTFDNAVMVIKEEHAKQRVSEIRQLTETVFRSNRMNYNVNFDVPNPNKGKPDAYGNVDQNETIYCTAEAKKVEDNEG